MQLKKVFASLLTGVMLLGAVAPVTAAALSGTVTASGSSAILPLAKKAGADFMSKNPGVTINISGGGSFTGLKQVAEGSVNIGNSDVPAGSEYPGLVAHKVAVAPFVIITNKSNSVSNLSQNQLIGIFTGKIKNWKQVGGANKAITIIGRASSSGSRATIKRIVLKNQEFTTAALSQDSSGSLRTAVSTTEGAIGYVDSAYINNTIKVLKYNNVAYSDANVVNGKYPIWTYEYMYTKGQATGAVKAYINYVLSPSFQNSTLKPLHFVSMSQMQGRKALTETKVAVKPAAKKPVVKAKTHKK